MVRPRSCSPEPEEAEKLGQDLVEWATEETDDIRTTWSIWYALKHGMIEKHWKALKQIPEFLPYYEIARSAMTKKLHSQVLEKGMSHRYIGMYDRSLYEFEDREADKNANRKAIENDTGMKDVAKELGNLSQSIKSQNEANQASHENQ